MLSFWQSILSEFQSNRKVALLYVVQSSGSSPGRQGFKMAVMENGSMKGSIGGGVMEHKLVELAKEKLLKKEDFVLLKKQVHSDSVAENKSGMICSGEQTICMLLVDNALETTVKGIINNIEQEENQCLKLSSKGIELIENQSSLNPFSFIHKNEKWEYLEYLNFKNAIHIIGSGHVGLALTRQMKWLGFHVKVYDDRAKLNTFEANQFADEKIIIDYDNIASQISGENDFVVLVSFGYRTDKKILEQLVGKPFRYLGMMGSKSKTNTLMEALKSEGFDEKHLANIHAPIGIDIQSKTPEEIAVSIAAQIIGVKNSLGESSIGLIL